MKDFKNRAPRIKRSSLTRVKFTPNRKKDVPRNVVNLSYTGMAFHRLPGDQWPAIDIPLNGILFLSGLELQVDTIIRRISTDTIGCRFLTDYSQIRTVMDTHFAPELLALKLRNQDDMVEHKTAGGIPHWFSDGNDCDLYYLEKLGKLQEFRIVYFDYDINFTAGGTPVIRVANHILKPAEDAMEKLKSGMMRFINNIEDLPHDHRININYVIHRIQG